MIAAGNVGRERACVVEEAAERLEGELVLQALVELGEDLVLARGEQDVLPRLRVRALHEEVRERRDALVVRPGRVVLRPGRRRQLVLEELLHVRDESS